MTLARPPLAVLAALAASPISVATAAAPPAGTPVQACNLTLNVIDQDPAGLNVRASPAGAIVTALKAKGRWVEVHVTGASGAWARIDGADVVSEDTLDDHPIPHASGWVAFSKLGIEELNMGATILAAPQAAAPLMMKIHVQDETFLPHADVLGCLGDFLKVRVKGVVGWTRDYCTNQLTTCA